MEKEEEKKEIGSDGVLLNSGVTDNQSQQQEQTNQILEEAFGESIEYEEISEVSTSPINEPVKEGEVSDGFAQEKSQTLEQPIDADEKLPEGILEEYEEELPPTDAPEQVVDDEEEEEFEAENGLHANAASPIDEANEHAAIAADTFLGIADNVLEIGGGFFIKIKKNKSHVYFDELIERSQLKDFKKIGTDIDQLNAANIKRIKLDDADRALLRPVLIEVLKKKTKQLTPEQQLAAITISIGIKKAQAVMEMKAANAIFAQNLNDRIEKQMARFEKLVEMKERELNVEKDGEENTEEEAPKAA